MSDSISLNFLERKASDGNADAQFRLYCIHKEGIGVPQSPEKAKQYLIGAAQNGNRQAMWTLSFAYKCGWFTFPKNGEEAHKWTDRLLAKINDDARKGDENALEITQILSGERKFGEEPLSVDQ
jgi:TPR repeat protein